MCLVLEQRAQRLLCAYVLVEVGNGNGGAAEMDIKIETEIEPGGLGLRLGVLHQRLRLVQ